MTKNVNLDWAMLRAAKFFPNEEGPRRLYVWCLSLSSRNCTCSVADAEMETGVRRNAALVVTKE